MKWKRIILDPSFWILLIANSLLVYKYEQNPGVFTTLIWLYWSQNILYWVFNFLDIRTTKKADISIESTPSVWTGDGTEKGTINATAWIFLVHFGVFHLGYLIFIASMAKTGPFDWNLYKYYLMVFFIFQLLDFIQRKIQNKNTPVNLGNMFFIPYLRVIPMHLCIMIPAFFNVSNLTVFLVMKVFADVIMYVVTNKYYQKNNILGEITTVNMESTIMPD